MEPRKFNWSVIVIAVLGGVLWLYLSRLLIPKPEGYKIASIQVISNGPVVVHRPAATSPAQVEKPVLPAAVAKAETASATPPPADASTDPQTDLKTALPDMARLLRHGGRSALRLAYYPPDFLAAQGPAMVDGLKARAAQAAAQPPSSIDEMSAKVYEAVVDQTPTFNAVGDVATFTVPPLTDLSPDVPPELIPTTVMMVKINGRWYMTNAATEAGRASAAVAR